MEVLGAPCDGDEQVGPVQAPVVDHQTQGVLHRRLIVQPNVLKVREGSWLIHTGFAGFGHSPQTSCKNGGGLGLRLEQNPCQPC